MNWITTGAVDGSANGISDQSRKKAPDDAEAFETHFETR
jgi:hypothetical protein